MKPETAAWLRRAERDLQAADLCLENELLEECIFHCQQALEKLLKSFWIEKADEGFPPRTHDLAGLADPMNLDVSEEQRNFLDDLSEQYMPTRYPDVPMEYTREMASDYHRKTRQFFEWLRQKLS
jgi:HEPN domain-containing protein